MNEYVEIRYTPRDSRTFRWAAWLMRYDGYPINVALRPSRRSAERAGRRMLDRRKVAIRYRLDADS